MTDGRAPGTTPARLAVVVVASLLGGMIAAVSVIGSDMVEPRLTAAAQEALRDAGIDRVDVRFDGREARLSGADASEGELAAAREAVEAVDGVRWATVDEAAPSGTAAPEEPRPTPTPTDAEPDPADLAALEAIAVPFSAGGAELGPAARAPVARIAELLLRYPDLRVRLAGHIAITTGTPAEVEAICLQRAQAVADALVGAGVEASRLDLRSAGAEEPAASNGTAAGAAQNRRVTVEIVEGA